MSNRDLVYEGPSRIGFVRIYEGDFVKFKYESPYIDSSNGWLEGKAFLNQYSCRDTITYRSPSYRYADDTDSHSFSPDNLVKWIPLGGKLEPRTGFGRFIRSIEPKKESVSA